MNTHPEEGCRGERRGSGNAPAMPHDPLSEAIESLRATYFGLDHAARYADERELSIAETAAAVRRAIARLVAYPAPIRARTTLTDDHEERGCWIYPDAEQVVA